MGKVKIKLNGLGVKALLQSAEIMAVCEDVANEAMKMCGDGYAMNTYVGKNRVNAMIYADTPEAIQDNLKNNTLAKAIGK